MNARDFLTHFILVAAVALVVSLVVTFLYTLIVHGHGILDWESSFLFAIVLGITIPLVRLLDRKKV